MPEKAFELQANASKGNNNEQKIPMKPFMNLLMAFLNFRDPDFWNFHQKKVS